MSARRRRGIIPPIILDEIERRGDEAAKVAARRTRVLSERFRGRRGRQPAVEPQHGERRTIHDAERGTRLPGKVVRPEDAPDTGDADADAAYDHLGATYDYFYDAHARAGLDGRNGPLRATVHYGQRFDNAFFDPASGLMVFGDGQVFATFAESLTVVAHELTHGVTDAESGLEYHGQPGALNEHLSDAFAALVEMTALGQAPRAYDWLIGRELFAGTTLQGRALRDMRRPGTAYDDPLLGRDPQPDHMRAYVETEEDDGGVHINSGVPNRAFAEACLALDRTVELGAIWYQALRTAPARCTFAEFVTLTMAAAATSAADVREAVRAGWAAVGLDPGPVPVPAPAPADEASPCEAEVLAILRDPAVRRVFASPAGRRLLARARAFRP